MWATDGSVEKACYIYRTTYVELATIPFLKIRFLLAKCIQALQ